jgi:hypothetical protein
MQALRFKTQNVKFQIKVQTSNTYQYFELFRVFLLSVRTGPRSIIVASKQFTNPKRKPVNNYIKFKHLKYELIQFKYFLRNFPVRNQCARGRRTSLEYGR